MAGCWHVFGAAAAGGGRGGRAVSHSVYRCVYYRIGAGSTMRLCSCSAGRTSWLCNTDYASLHTVGMQLHELNVKASMSNELSARYTVLQQFVYSFSALCVLLVVLCASEAGRSLFLQ